MFADAFGETRRIGREFQVGAIDLDQRREGCKPDEAVELRDDRLMSLNIVAEHRGELARHVGREFEPDDAAAAAAAERGAEQAHTTLGFFLDLDVAVANATEAAPLEDRADWTAQVAAQP